MPKSARLLALGLLLMLAATLAGAQTAPGTGFTYQGQLAMDGLPVTGACDFQFTLWDAAGSGTPPTGGSALGVAVSLNNVAVDHGLFTVLLNAGNEFGVFAFNGDARWLQISVRSPAGSGAWSVLSPRQALTQTPVAATLRPGALITARQQAYGLSVYNMSTGPVTGVLGVGGSAAGGGALPDYSAVDKVGVNGSSANGFGVLGSSDAAPGVLGMSGNAPGVMGYSTLTDGVRGYGGANGNNGVLGTAGSYGGSGVRGEGTGSGVGVRGVHNGGGLAGRFDGNIQVNGDAQVSGNINAGRFNAGVILNTSGGQSLTGNYTTHGGTLLVFVSGSGFSNVPYVWLGVNILIDGVVFDHIAVPGDLGNHQAFVPKQLVVTGLAPGVHTFQLVPYANTFTDGMDSFYISAVELPF